MATARVAKVMAAARVVVAREVELPLQLAVQQHTTDWNVYF